MSCLERCESGAHGTTFAFLIPLEVPAALVPAEAAALAMIAIPSYFVTFFLPAIG